MSAGTHPSRSGRQQAIVDHLCRRIANGALAPGERLPTHEQIQRRFRTTRVTVQRAFDRLAAEGFVSTRPKIGRFVAERLPHRARYGLVFAGSPRAATDRTWTRFDAAMLEASRVVARRDGVSFPLYFDVKGHSDSEGYQVLLRDVEAHRLTGLIFTFAPHDLAGTALMDRPDPPRINTRDERHSILRGPDERVFMYRAIDALLADGRRRFAVITKPEADRGYPDEFAAAVASRGAITRPFWTQAVDPVQTTWVRHALDAILSTRAESPPDALLVTDDHLVEAVADALVEFGVRVPEQMRVVGHWNFPNPYRRRLPIDLLGFDACELVRTWVETIEALRRGERVAPIVTLRPRFTWELPADAGGTRMRGRAPIAGYVQNIESLVTERNQQ